MASQDLGLKKDIYFKMLNWKGGLILILIYSLYVFYMFLKMEKNQTSKYEQQSQKSKESRIILFLKLDFYGALIGNKKLNKANSILLHTLRFLSYVLVL